MRNLLYMNGIQEVVGSIPIGSTKVSAGFSFRKPAFFVFGVVGTFGLRKTKDSIKTTGHWLKSIETA